jgi:hypothetical protein
MLYWLAWSIERILLLLYGNFANKVDWTGNKDLLSVDG